MKSQNENKKKIKKLNPPSLSLFILISQSHIQFSVKYSTVSKNMLLLKKPKKIFSSCLKKKCFTVSVGWIKWKKKMSGFFVSTLWLLVYCTDTKIICKNTIYAE